MKPKHLLLALLVIMVWGVNFVMIKIGVAEMPPLAFLATRYAITGLLLLPFLKWPGWDKAKWCILQGLVLGLLQQGTAFTALTEMPAGLLSIIMQSNVILVTIMGIFIFHEKVGWRTWLGILIGIAGVIVLIGIPEEGTTSRGLTLAMLSVLFMAFSYIIMKKIGDINAITYMVLMSLPIAPFMILTSLYVEGTEWLPMENVKWDVLTIAMLYQIFVMSLSHMVWQKLMTKAPIAKIMPLTLLVPIFGVLAAIIILDETISPVTLAGGFLTIAGVAIVTFRQTKRAEKKNTMPPQHDDAH